MSWIAGSLLVLGLALVAGFAWYERSHPSSRVLALVAALAALAVIGRIAFAPIPNVKPTTDIVLLAGFALGGAPGFAVGAVTALASNLFFGQGPWTPWQMVAWGLVGVGGAALARLAGRDLGRWPLALACGVAGLAYGAIMDLSQWVMYSGDHTSAKLVAYAATSLPFNLAHAFGNVVFGLAFGPVLLAALTRYRRRFTIHWAPVAAGLLAVLVLAAPAPDARASVRSSAEYLLKAQNDDGGFPPSPGAGSTQLHTGWVVMGLSAAGRSPDGALAYMRANASKLRGDVGELTRTILALRALGASPRSFAGRDLVAELQARRRPDGSWAGRVNSTAFGVLALRAAGEPAGRSVRWIAAQAHRDGGFGITGSGPSGIDETGCAIQALVAGGRKGTRTVRRAVRWLLRRQNADGGFPLQPGGPSNAQSTAWAIQGIVAAGRNPEKVRRDGSRSPLGYLRRLTGPDGAIRYSRTSAQTPVWVTGQALAALARKPLPIRPLARPARAAAAPQATPEPRPTATPRPQPTAAPRRKPRKSPVPVVPDVAPAARTAGFLTGLALAPIVGG